MQADKIFSGSIPQLYEEYLVPLIFEPYATDLAGRAAETPPARLLELAAGTGVVTRALARLLPPGTEIVATDLNQPMLDRARAIGMPRPVTWQQADVVNLPFDDGSFDTVVCEFGVMFFPRKAADFVEARRVLKPGGRLLFSTWDRIEDNEFADVVTHELARLFPTDPPRFLARTPHGYFDKDTIVRDLAAAGFHDAEFATVTARSRAASSRQPAIAYCEGTPLRNEIEARSASGLTEATDATVAAIAARFGRGAVDGKIQALIVSVGV